MSEFFLYFLKVMVMQGLLLMTYWLVLKNRKAFAFTRIYLLFGLIAAFLVPQLRINPIEPAPLKLLQESYVEPIAASIAARPEEMTKDHSQSSNSVDWSQWFLLVVGTGAVGLLLRYFLRLRTLWLRTKNQFYVKHSNYKLYPFHGEQAFSFFSHIFIPKRSWKKPEFDTLLLHEVAHARHAHSVDRLIVDFIIALCWFNPFIYLFRRELIAIHEYQADETVLRRFPDRIAYQELIFAFVSRRPLGMASALGAFSIKNRIKMMNRRKNSSKNVLSIVITCLAAAMVFMAFTHKPGPTASATSRLGGPWADPFAQFAPKPQPTNTVPSIFPIDPESDHRISSGFGQRKNPWTGKMQTHLGLDIVAPVGTPVYATADGVVSEAEAQFGGFGNQVLIQHEDDYVTHFAHLQKFIVTEDQKVRQGEVIGYVGSTGKSTGPHLHYAVNKEGKYVDPADYFPELHVQP